MNATPRNNPILQRVRDHGAKALTPAELIAATRYRYPTDEHVDAIRKEIANKHGIRDCVADDPRTAVAMELAARCYYEDVTKQSLANPRDAAAFLKAKLCHLQHEVFAVLFLDNRHRILGFKEMFTGTLDGASVHPREVVRAALEYNAAALIFAHNHPSGVAEPSAADRNITRQLRDALQLVGVRVLDHIVVGAGEPTSMAARGLI